jgi:hypothetical protein
LAARPTNNDASVCAFHSKGYVGYNKNQRRQDVDSVARELHQLCTRIAARIARVAPAKAMLRPKNAKAGDIAAPRTPARKRKCPLHAFSSPKMRKQDANAVNHGEDRKRA